MSPAAPRGTRVASATRMPIEIVFNEHFEQVQDAVYASLAECGFAVRPTPLGGANVQSKMGFWLGEKGNKLLAMLLPFIFKVDSVSAVITAYQDGTTGLTLRQGSSYGGNFAQGVVSSVSPLGLGSTAAHAADQVRKSEALTKLLGAVDEKLRTRLGAKIAYEGPVRPGVHPVMI
jgi:hypothetical protein